MIGSGLLVMGAAVLAAGMVAGPASAATDGSSIPGGAGYLVSPTAFHTARVTLTVPKISCSRSSRTRTVELGIFATRTSRSEPTPAPVSLTVDATCVEGRTRYRALYRNGGAFPMPVHAGDRVRLTLGGVESWEVDDMTRGSGEGGATSSAGGDRTPHAGRHVLIGAEVLGAAPHGVRTVLHDAIVNHTDLANVPHHRQGRTARLHVGSLHHHDFLVTVV